MKKTMSHKKAMVGWNMVSHFQKVHLVTLGLGPQNIRVRKQVCVGPNSNTRTVETKGSNDAIQEMHDLAMKLNLEMAFAQYPPTQRLSKVYPEALITTSQANSPVKISTLEFVEEDQCTIQLVLWIVELVRC